MNRFPNGLTLYSNIFKLAKMYSPVLYIFGFDFLLFVLDSLFLCLNAIVKLKAIFILYLVWVPRLY